MSPTSKLPIDELLKQLEVGREGATRVMAGSKPFHGRYNRARDIVMAIDELVEVLTCDREKIPYQAAWLNRRKRAGKLVSPQSIRHMHAAAPIERQSRLRREA